MDGVCVSFGQIEVLNVHVPLDCQQIPGSVFIEEGELFVAVYDHEMCSTCVETEIADGIAGEWLDDTKTVHVFIHAVEVPQPHVIIKSAGCHSMTFGLHDAARNCFFMTI